jgi:hypothetical protein
VEQAIGHVQQLSRLLSIGGFRLTKWVSNSDQILSDVPGYERSAKVCSLTDGRMLERALGVKRNVDSDTFTFSVTDKDKPATRRGILSVISSIFDPLGLISPFVLPAKRLLQELRRKTIGWDDKIKSQRLSSKLGVHGNKITLN